MTERNAPGRGAPIGVFDSGLGGLTAVRELRRILPGEDIVYFGDTGRVPYGTRGVDVIVRYAKQDIAFLLEQNVKYVMAACGTVSSTLPEAYTRTLPVPYTGVVQSAAAAAVRATRTGLIGVIGTPATVKSGSYNAAIAALMPGARIVATACPLFVPLVENGFIQPDNEITAKVVIVAEGIGHSQEIANEIQARTGIDTRATILGHVQRGGSPTLRDRVNASAMGYHAVCLLEQGKYNRIVGMKGEELVDYPVDEALEMTKSIDPVLVDVCNTISI